MGMLSLSKDQQALLYLLYIYTDDSSRYLWIKELHLNALIYYLIKNNVFVEYDYAPTLVTFHGVKMYGKVSQEALWDLERFRRIGMVQKLKFSNKFYDDVGAYRLHNGISKIEAVVSLDVRKEVEDALRCRRGYKKVQINEHRKHGRTVLEATLLCEEKKEPIDFFDVGRVEYSSKTYIPGGF
jgi:hypothetical protein